MDGWVRQNAVAVAIGLGAVAAVLLVAGVVLLVLWRVARSRLARAETARAAAERDRIDFELLSAEQTSRLRIIRELHELIVPSMSVIISQADGARYAAADDPSVAARTSTTIAATAREALGDLRRVMTVVRDGETDAGPQPGLAGVRELLDVMRDAGLAIRFDEIGEPLQLRDGAELAVYGILHEALANALAHGGDGTEARVSLAWTERGLELRIDDDGVRAAARRRGRDPDLEAQRRDYSAEDDLAALTDEPAGRGMTEMRERAEIFGGVFHAGAVPGVGFSVSAIFPTIADHNGIHGVKL